MEQGGGSDAVQQWEGDLTKAFHHIQIDVEDMKWWPINKNSKILWCVHFLFLSFSYLSSVEFSIRSFS